MAPTEPELGRGLAPSAAYRALLAAPRPEGLRFRGSLWIARANVPAAGLGAAVELVGSL